MFDFVHYLATLGSIVEFKYFFPLFIEYVINKVKCHYWNATISTYNNNSQTVFVNNVLNELLTRVVKLDTYLSNYTDETVHCSTKHLLSRYNLSTCPVNNDISYKNDSKVDNHYAQRNADACNCLPYTKSHIKGQCVCACFDCRLIRLSCVNSNNKGSLGCSYTSVVLENTHEQMEHIENETALNNVDINDINRVEYSTFSLNILSLNVCGLKGKITTPEFPETINKYSIIEFQETKLDDTDFIQLNNFEMFF